MSLSLVVRGCSDPVGHLLVLDLRVQRRQALLVRLEEVISAVVCLNMTMLGAEDVGALAGYLDNAHFLGAVPALVLVGLSEKRKSR